MCDRALLAPVECVGEEEKWWAAWRAECAPALVENESADVESRETGEPSMMAGEVVATVREMGEHAKSIGREIKSCDRSLIWTKKQAGSMECRLESWLSTVAKSQTAN